MKTGIPRDARCSRSEDQGLSTLIPSGRAHRSPTLDDKVHIHTGKQVVLVDVWQSELVHRRDAPVAVQIAQRDAMASINNVAGRNRRGEIPVPVIGQDLVRLVESIDDEGV